MTDSPRTTPRAPSLAANRRWRRCFRGVRSLAKLASDQAAAASRNCRSLRGGHLTPELDDDRVWGRAKRALPLRPARAGVCRSSASMLAHRPNEQRERGEPGAPARPAMQQASRRGHVLLLVARRRTPDIRLHARRGRSARASSRPSVQEAPRGQRTPPDLSATCRPFSFKMLSVSPDLNLSPFVRDLLRDYPRFTPTGGVHPIDWRRAAGDAALTRKLGISGLRELTLLLEREEARSGFRHGAADAPADVARELESAKICSEHAKRQLENETPELNAMTLVANGECAGRIGRVHSPVPLG